jgi:hypothetical protein
MPHEIHRSVHQALLHVAYSWHIDRLRHVDRPVNYFVELLPGFLERPFLVEFIDVIRGWFRLAVKAFEVFDSRAGVENDDPFAGRDFACGTQ